MLEVGAGGWPITRNREHRIFHFLPLIWLTTLKKQREQRAKNKAPSVWAQVLVGRLCDGEASCWSRSGRSGGKVRRKTQMHNAEGNSGHLANKSRKLEEGIRGGALTDADRQTDRTKIPAVVRRKWNHRNFLDNDDDDDSCYYYIIFIIIVKDAPIRTPVS